MVVVAPQVATVGEVLPGNALQSTLSAGISASDGTLSIGSGDAAKWPTLGTYRAVLWQDAAAGPWELVQVYTGQGTATLGIHRAFEPYNGDQTARAWPIGTRIAPVLTQDGLGSVVSSSMFLEEFQPGAGTTVITLSRNADRFLMVARNGLIQSHAAGHYNPSAGLGGSTITFASSFSGSEYVVVTYITRSSY